MLMTVRVKRVMIEKYGNSVKAILMETNTNGLTCQVQATKKQIK